MIPAISPSAGTEAILPHATHTISCHMCYHKTISQVLDTHHSYHLKTLQKKLIYKAIKKIDL